MKNCIIKYLVFASMVLIFSCDKNFEEINTNKVDPTSASVDPIFLLNNAIINTSNSNTQIIYDMGIVQQLISPNSGLLTGANYNQDNRQSLDDHWIKYYQNVIKNTGDIKAQLSAENAQNRPNLLNMTLLVESLAFMILTDEHGDVPYFEAGKGVSDQIVLPAYTPQEEIYKDLIKVVRNATASLSTSAPAENGEVMYSGDIGRWKRFGSSLLLRLGMRLTEVDLALAEQTVKEAFAGGVMLSNDDNYVIRHDSNYTNNAGVTLNATEANNFYMVDTFVEFLQDSNDPRLESMAVRYIGAASGPEQVPENGSTDPEDQIGMPMGFDNSTIAGVAEQMNLPSFYAFTQVDRNRFIKQTAPMFMVTHSQTQLLLAEAAVRGWVTGNPAGYFEAGVRAHMEQMAAYDPESAIPSEDIDTYLAAQPFDSGNALEQINNQYWVSSFLNGPEAFANFRRSGFPVLTPNPYPAQDITGDFINRLTYPTDEIATNNANLSEAVARMGPDNLDTKVWWDK
ncbi:Starch-binding associating with outer membrane [Pricia antarctica]|uniref:Starch-binding associating with outer membrane n=1 Tax=Pricia antarctica TaxID=641691 RepID=A0A1G7BHI3_9FLAO|nr:SusD/RagB family nutrient-binding outer membrane lipoprotein [Pricia antarctica]SDE26357.1 Starch-binding associating with outer membrane [Pricia antarctica]